MVNGFYVWSHAIQSSNESAIGQMTAQDFANLWEEKGPMDADRRNVASISGMWNIDYYHGTNFFMKEVVNGGTISPVWVMQSGQPFSVTTGSNKNDDSANANRPDFDTVNRTSAFLDPHRNRAAAAARVVQHCSIRQRTALASPGASDPAAPTAMCHAITCALRVTATWIWDSFAIFILRRI